MLFYCAMHNPWNLAFDRLYADGYRMRLAVHLPAGGGVVSGNNGRTSVIARPQRFALQVCRGYALTWG